uniref:Fzd-4-2 n=1 Tax=Dendrocoelum lacteum TaxID=27895 RepID=T1DBN2_9PLAT
MKMVTFFIFSVTFFQLFQCHLQGNRVNEDLYNQCVIIKDPACQGIQYTKTKMPNLAGITNQEDSAKRLHDYHPLINAECSNYFRFFLCTVYFPMCSDALGSPSIVYPCKQLCLYAESRCEPYLRAFQLPWPNELNCQRFPTNSTMCIEPKNYDLDLHLRRFNPGDIDHIKKLYPQWNISLHSSIVDARLIKGRKDIVEMVETTVKCSPPFVSRPYYLHISNQSTKFSCVLRCDANLLYNSSDKYLAKVWLLVWALSGLISSIVAIATFLFDRKSRFKYPERPIVFIVICYGCVCVFHLIQLMLGKERMICQPLYSNPKELVIMRESAEGPLCTLMFLGSYYFETVATLWWLMLAVSCFLASSRKWSAEALEGISNIMHMISWMIPALKVTIILIIHKIDSDELMGMCFVGRHNALSNLLFILLPRITYFFIGVMLLLWSFRSLVLIRKDLTQPGLVLFLDGFQNQQSLDKFIVKTGIFCGVYGIPMICYIGCQIYNYLNIDNWNNIGKTLLPIESRCLSKSGLRWTDTSCTNHLSLPLIEVRLLETFSSLVIGITSAMWMWCNKKTFITFSQLCIKKMPCRTLSKTNTNMEMIIPNKPQLCYKSIQPNTYQFSDYNFNRNQICLPSSVNQETLCYNSNLII